jgi:hypothetical protein
MFNGYGYIVPASWDYPELCPWLSIYYNGDVTYSLDGNGISEVLDSTTGMYSRHTAF